MFMPFLFIIVLHSRFLNYSLWLINACIIRKADSIVLFDRQ